MPRYVLPGDRFWEITRTGATLSIASAKLGSAARTLVKQTSSEADAIAQHDDLIAQMVAKGYVLDVPVEEAAPAPDAAPIDEPRNAELEAAILADPANADAYLVYADWLQTQGDPRGELIVLQHRGEKAAGTLLRQHAARFVDGIASKRAALRWKWGFLDEVIVKSERKQRKLLRALMRHPSSRFLRRLEVHARTAVASQHLVEVLRRVPRSLRELELRANAHLGDLSALWPGLRGLRRLSLAAVSYELGEFALPGLERAVFAFGSRPPERLSAASFRAVARAPWPELVRLEVMLADAIGPRDVHAFLARTDLPKLTHLRLKFARVGDVFPALFETPMLANLQVLDLSHGTITPDDAALLLSRRVELAHLRELWLPYDVTVNQHAFEGLSKRVLIDPATVLLGVLGPEHGEELDEDDEHYDAVHE